MFTPHARGSTLRQRQNCCLNRVYPACAGIDLIPRASRGLSVCLPRMRGDRPNASDIFPTLAPFTACEDRPCYPYPQSHVGRLPACEIDLIMWLSYQRSTLPACAGDRPTQALSTVLETVSPACAIDNAYHGGVVLFGLPRGGSTLCITLAVRTCLYPACAGIDRRIHRWLRLLRRLPRMRGDRPLRPRCIWGWMKFTPHARGSTPDTRSLLF